MNTKNIEFTRAELWTLRSLISSEMLKASEILDKTGNSSDPTEMKLFSYWFDKYQVLKSSYDKLFRLSYDKLYEDS